jgi:fluoride exporter
VLLLALVALGGAIGSIARYLASTSIQRWSASRFPLGTYVVNGAGSFIVGLAFALLDGSVYSDDLLVFLVAGLLGGFTTFSTFSLENLKLLEAGRYRWLLSNTVGQVVGGLALAGLGFWLGSVVG